MMLKVPFRDCNLAMTAAVCHTRQGSSQPQLGGFTPKLKETGRDFKENSIPDGLKV